MWNFMCWTANGVSFGWQLSTIGLFAGMAAINLAHYICTFKTVVRKERKNFKKKNRSKFVNLEVFFAVFEWVKRHENRNVPIILLLLPEFLAIVTDKAN